MTLLHCRLPCAHLICYAIDTGPGVWQKCCSMPGSRNSLSHAGGMWATPSCRARTSTTWACLDCALPAARACSSLPSARCGALSQAPAGGMRMGLAGVMRLYCLCLEASHFSSEDGALTVHAVVQVWQVVPAACLLMALCMPKAAYHLLLASTQCIQGVATELTHVGCQVLLMFGPEYARSCGVGALEPLGIYLPGDQNYPGKKYSLGTIIHYHLTVCCGEGMLADLCSCCVHAG